MLEDQDLKSIQQVRTKIALAHSAYLKFRNYTQQQVDAIVDHVAAVARANAEPLARLAVEETRYGNVRDKVAKNLLNSDLLHKAVGPLKTAGIISEDRERGIIEVAEPVGVVAAILPTTNPTSTAFFKTLISLKGRNAIVISPHPRAVKCTCESARILAEAAEQAGAPEGIVQCLNEASLAGTNELMRHRLTGVILATGGTALVRAAYSSGKPAFGVGPGNVPVLLEASADVNETVRSVVEGKSFDYGTVCSSEQSLVAEVSRRDEVLAALKANGSYLCNDQEAATIEKLLITKDFRINPDCVGQSPEKIAGMAGIQIPAGTRILVVDLKGIGKEHPLSAEKLSPVLSVYFVKNFEQGIQACVDILNFGGRGHTCAIYSKNDDRIKEFGMRVPAFRVLVNTPTPQGSTGITTNVFPSMTLGCGAIAGNVTSDNVSPMHLINIKRIAYHVRDAEKAFDSPEAKAFFAGEALSAPPAISSGSKPQIADAVTRYLASRGLASAAPAPAPPPQAAIVASPAASVVDRFLAERKAGSAVKAASPAPEAVPAPATAPNPSPEPPAPKVEVVSFVCEQDIRRAMTEQKKIYINKKSIITPAARDLNHDGDVLVRTD